MIVFRRQEAADTLCLFPGAEECDRDGAHARGRDDRSASELLQAHTSQRNVSTPQLWAARVTFCIFIWPFFFMNGSYFFCLFFMSSNGTVYCIPTGNVSQVSYWFFFLGGSFFLSFFILSFFLSFFLLSMINTWVFEQLHLREKKIVHKKCVF